jgi:hypothetical protein
MGPAQYSSLLIHHPTPVRVRVYYSNKNRGPKRETGRSVGTRTRQRSEL